MKLNELLEHMNDGEIVELSFIDNNDMSHYSIVAPCIAIVEKLDEAVLKKDVITIRAMERSTIDAHSGATVAVTLFV